MKSYRTHFKKQDGPHGKKHYIKDNYDFTPFCNSRFASSNTNMLSRLQNSLATGLNKMKEELMPSYVLVVPDDDLITFLDFKKDGAATLLGSWIEWLSNQFRSTLEEQLPHKCRYNTFIYWVAAPVHSNFSHELNNLRTKFNLALDSVIRTKQNMRVIRLKEYWNAIDASFYFNVMKQKIFVAKQTYLQSQPDTSATATSAMQEDQVPKFFKKYKNAEYHMDAREDRRYSSYVEPHMGVQEDNRNFGQDDRFFNPSRNRYMLPQPDRCFKFI